MLVPGARDHWAPLKANPTLRRVADSQGNKGGLGMKKMFMAAAALTIAVAIAPTFVSQSLAASGKARAHKAAAEKSPYCDMAKSQRNTPSWNEHYGCLKTPARQAFAAPSPTAAAAQQDARSTYCGLAKNQRNTPSWNEYYGCLH
jgi:hypothetical protein